ELELQLALGRALMATRGYGVPAVGEFYSRARQLCVQLNRVDKLLPILAGQWTHHQLRGDLERAQQLAVGIRQLGEIDDDVLTRGWGCYTSGFTTLFLGEVACATAYLERGANIYGAVQWSSVPSDIDLSVIRLLGLLSFALACCGYLDQARSRSEWILGEA